MGDGEGGAGILPAGGGFLGGMGEWGNGEWPRIGTNFHEWRMRGANGSTRDNYSGTAEVARGGETTDLSLYQSAPAPPPAPPPPDEPARPHPS